MIKKLLVLGEWEPHYCCWSPDKISPDEIGDCLEKEVKYGDTLQKQIFNVEPRNQIHTCRTCLEALERLKEEYGSEPELDRP